MHHKNKSFPVTAVQRRFPGMFGIRLQQLAAILLLFLPVLVLNWLPRFQPFNCFQEPGRIPRVTSTSLDGAAGEPAPRRK